jgi:hypothetical protein
MFSKNFVPHRIANQMLNLRWTHARLSAHMLQHAGAAQSIVLPHVNGMLFEAVDSSGDGVVRLEAMWRRSYTALQFMVPRLHQLPQTAALPLVHE